MGFGDGARGGVPACGRVFYALGEHPGVVGEGLEVVLDALESLGADLPPNESNRFKRNSVVRKFESRRDVCRAVTNKSSKIRARFQWFSRTLGSIVPKSRKLKGNEISRNTGV